MAAEFMRRLLGQARPPSAEVAEALEELRHLAAEKPALAEAAAFLIDVLRYAFVEVHASTAAQSPLTLPSPPAKPGREREGGTCSGSDGSIDDRARAKLESGVPLLRGETMPWDSADFARRWQQICAAMRPQDAGKALRAALSAGSLDPQWLIAETLAGRPEAIHARAAELGLDAGVTATVLRLTLFPILAAFSTKRLPPSIRWDQGYCPTCGSWPLLGEFRGLEQTRFLRCGLCATGWEFPRLRCPFCACTDHRQLGYFFIEAEEGKYRAATCDACRGYVKMISTLSALSPPRLLVADLATMHLDLAAADRGFQNELLNPIR